MKPSAVFRFITGRAQLWHPWPAQVGDFNADDVVRCLDCDRDRLAAGGRAAVPDTVNEKLVHQQGSYAPARVPGAEYPVHERAGDPRPLRPPQESWSPGPPQSSAQPPFPARTDPGGARGAGRAHTGMHARLGGARQVWTRRQRGPSVAVRGNADGAHRPP